MRNYNNIFASKDLACLECSTAKGWKRCEEIIHRMDKKLAIRQRKIEADLEKELSKLNLLEFV